MPVNVKALVVVLPIAIVVFALARPLALRFSNPQDFARRRDIWLILTFVGFLSPSFWLFVVVAVPLLAWGGRKDSNPIAFYLLLLNVLPVVDVEIPVVGIESLFPLNIYRLLSFCILIPVAWRLRRLPVPTGTPRGRLLDGLVLAYGLLQVVLVRPGDSATGAVRHAFLFLIDVYLVYYAVSRFCRTRDAIREAQVAFCLSCALMAAMGAFETVRHWLLYSDFSSRWGVNDFLSGFYLLRGGSLRALASSGNTLALGYLIAVAFGFWLYVQSRVPSRRSRIAVIILYWIGLLATYSRGPWMGAIAIYFCFTAFGTHRISGVLRSAGLAGLVFAVVIVSPLGERIIQVLPFMGGSVDVGSIEYRQQLAQRAWELFWVNPLLGDRLVLSKMESLRQGVGLIDLVNTYAEVALFYGLVGLVLFLSPILVALFRVYRVAAKSLRTDVDLALLGASLLACMLGTLLMIATCSFILGYQKLFYVLLGLATAYAGLDSSRRMTADPTLQQNVSDRRLSA